MPRKPLSGDGEFAVGVEGMEIQTWGHQQRDVLKARSPDKTSGKGVATMELHRQLRERGGKENEAAQPMMGGPREGRVWTLNEERVQGEGSSRPVT